MSTRRSTFYPQEDSEDESDQYYTDDSDIDDGPARFPSARAHAPATPPPRYSSTTSLPNYTLANLCIVCQRRPPYYNARTGQSYPTCGLTCAAVLSQQGASSSGSRSSYSAHSGSRRHGSNGYSHRDSTRRSTYQVAAGVAHNQPKRLLCVVCKKGNAQRNYVTCGLTCAEKLCKDGGDPTMCNYCHQKPKNQGHEQCGNTCAEKAKIACLLCKCRPKNGRRYHLCGKTCKRIAMKSTPIILEAPKGHKTYEMAEDKFKKAWQGGTAPVIKKIYKIIENDEFLKPYAAHKQKVGNEVFRYHGTKRQCQLGISTTQLCTATSCAVCNILKTSFKVSLAGNGCYGRGIYSSSASNKAFGYCGAAGVMLLTKVCMGKPYTVGVDGAFTGGCPSGFDCVVANPGGPANETIVYTDDAIRPVFLIVF